jgi:hypothetical protein
MDDNTSGQGERARVPAEIDRWSWGAFLLNWIWGLGNDTYIALLMFLPGVNLVMMFVLGAKGSAWAWRNKPWRDVAHFRRVQRLWAIWGVVAWAGIIGLAAVMTVSFLWLFSHSQPYAMAVERLKQNPAAVAALGSPISAGFPMGHIAVENDTGSAELSFSATGPNGSGTVYVDARKTLGAWRLSRFELELAGRDQTIDLDADSKRLPPLKPPVD